MLSQYTRALKAIQRKLPSAANIRRYAEIVRERYAFACDIGAPRTELERAWPEHTNVVLRSAARPLWRRRRKMATTNARIVSVSSPSSSIVFWTPSGPHTQGRCLDPRRKPACRSNTRLGPFRGLR